MGWLAALASLIRPRDIITKMNIRETALKIVDYIRLGGTVFVIGNGGSAAGSQHFVAELIGRYKLKRKALPAIALTTDTSVLTAIGNDFGFEDIFTRQLEGLAKKGDILLTLSTSGTSKNILRAIQFAERNGLKVISLPTNKALGKTTSETQEVHLKILHKLAGLIEKEFINEKT